MCLVLLAWQRDVELPLIVAGNRDEFHGRPAEALHWWPDRPGILAGRDLQAGGTWLALGRNGRFATVTNYRDAVPPSAGHRSRGELVTNFVDSDIGALDFATSIEFRAYAGFSLFVYDGSALAFSSNRDGGGVELEPGIYGLANAGLDAPWHKTLVSKARLEAALREGTVNPSVLFRLLGDRELGPAEDVSTDGLGFALAHALTAPFVVQPEYGTRCSTVVLMSANGRIEINERRFHADGSRAGETRKSYVAE